MRFRNYLARPNQSAESTSALGGRPDQLRGNIRTGCNRHIAAGETALTSNQFDFEKQHKSRLCGWHKLPFMTFYDPVLNKLVCNCFATKNFQASSYFGGLIVFVYIFL